MHIIQYLEHSLHSDYMQDNSFLCTFLRSKLSGKDLTGAYSSWIPLFGPKRQPARQEQLQVTFEQACI